MSSALRLQVEEGLAALTFDLPDKKVNVFTRQVLAELERMLHELRERDDIAVLILLSGKRGNFIAGADIEEIAHVADEKEAAEGARYGQRLFSEWSDLAFPTIAAVQGTCLGGGTELALASDLILLSDRSDIRIGLPEIKIGIVPAWGGCTRLPRRVGLMAALDIILAGKAVSPNKAYRIGLADALLPDGDFRYQVHKMAHAVLEGRPPRGKKKGLKSALLDDNPIGRKLVLSQARKKVVESTGGHYPAPLRAIEVVRTGMSRGAKAGFEAEARAAGQLAITPECKNLIHLFHLMEANKKDSNGAESKSIRAAAVLGAGVMGGGIAQLISLRGDIPVRLKDLGSEPLSRGMGHAASLFRKLVARRRLSKPEAARKMALMQPTTSYAGFERVDLVIEAIVENLEIKQSIFAELAEITHDDAILATNTSSLSIDAIGRDATIPERVVGMHFFNPVHKMPLVEVIRGPRTSATSVATVSSFARALGKTPVVVNDGPGFLVNRLLTFYLTEALWLMNDGFAVETIDRAMTDWGMPMGPLELVDEIGIDVSVKVSHIMADAVGDRLPIPPWVEGLSSVDRMGKKTGKGIYRYEKGKRSGLDPSIYGLVGLDEPAVAAPNESLIDRLVLPMVDEAARCLDEEIVATPGDVDLAMILGTGFPPFRGGLCRWADQQGLRAIEKKLMRLSADIGERFRPSTALRELATGNGFYGS